MPSDSRKWRVKDTPVWHERIVRKLANAIEFALGRQGLDK